MSLLTEPATQLAYSSGASDVPLLGQTIGENLRRTVERFGDRDALVVRHQAYRASYDELWRQVDLAAGALLAHGVAKGDRVGIWASNRYEWVVTQFATARVSASSSRSTRPTRSRRSSTRSPRPASASC
jgi:fatty-acyl-CoA synthase